MAAGDLCSLSEVRSFLQKTGGDTAQDTIIQSLITRASAAISRHAERQFAPTETATTHTFEHEFNRDGFVDLAPYDLRTVTSVQIDTDTGTAGTLGTSEWRLFPQPPADGVYTAIRLVPTTRGGWSRFRHVQIQITGDWGFAAVPEDVKHCAIVTTAIWLRRDVAAFSSTFKLDEDRVERPEGLPSSVRATLASWRRIGAG